MKCISDRIMAYTNIAVKIAKYCVVSRIYEVISTLSASVIPLISTRATSSHANPCHIPFLSCGLGAMCDEIQNET